MVGSIWMVLLRLAERSIGLVSTLILARMLTPSDFGLVAMAIAVLALIELMGSFGFDVALIQLKHTDRGHYDTAWTFNLMFSTGTAFLLLVFAIPVAGFYHEPRLTLILIALSVGAMAQGFENVGTVAFRKEMNFRKEFFFILSKKLFTFIITISLALTFRSYWALVGGIVTGKIFSTWFSYRLHPYRPKFSLGARQELFHFSKWLLISNVVIFLQNKADSFILGRTVGAHGLGLYNVAGELSALPATELIAPLNRAAFPAYSKLAPNLPELRRKFLEVFGFISIVAIPASVGLTCVAQPAIRVLLGQQWNESVYLMQILTIASLAGALQSNLFVVITALGKPKANTLLSAAMSVIYIPTVVFASLKYGALGAAWTHLVLSIALQIPLNIVFIRITGIQIGEYFATLWRPTIASLTMAIFILNFFNIMPSEIQQSPILELMSAIIVGVVSYVVTILLLWIFSGKPEASAEGVILRLVISKLKVLKR